MTKKKAAAWIIVFALLVIGPGIIYHFAEPYINTENTENRQLAEKPVLSRDNLQTFASEYNSYYNDHLAFRSQMIEANSVLSMNVFRDSSSSSVVLGKNNWLFFTDEGSIEDYKGTNLYTREQLELIKDNILSTKAYLEARGIEFIIKKKSIRTIFLTISGKEENRPGRSRLFLICAKRRESVLSIRKKN